MVETDFRLGEWVVRPQRCCIEFAGKSVHVKPKSMAVLERLAHADGAVVPRNDILDAVWPGAAVTDDVLTQSVTELRKAFGDTPQDPNVIETVPKKGLRLMIEVTWIDESGRRGAGGAAPDQRRPTRSAFRSGLIVAAIGTVLIAGWLVVSEREEPVGPADGKTLAVLPFADLSRDGDQEYFANGLTDELIDRLTQLEGLRVTARTSSKHFRNSDEDVASIARTLSVRHILEGSVRRDGDELKVIATLTDTESGFQVWSQSYERIADEIFDVQRGIAESVAAALSIELGVGEFELVEGGTRNIEAYEAFRAGFAAEDADDLMLAIRNFERATELDPQFALAWAELSECYHLAFLSVGGSKTVPFRKWRDEAIDQAVRIAPGARQVQETSAQMEINRNDLQNARAIFDQIHQGDAPAAPRYSLPYIDLLTKTGHVGDALWVAGRVFDRDPLNPKLALYLAHLNLSLSRFDQALHDIGRAYEIGNIQAFFAVEAVYVALAMNETDVIRQWLDTLKSDSPSNPWNVHHAMLEHLGDADNALDWLRRAYDRSAGYDYHVINWASYYGDNELALRAMQRSRDLWTFWTPLTAELRKTEEFKAIVRDVGLVDYWRQYGWNDFCQPVGDDDFECR